MGAALFKRFVELIFVLFFISLLVFLLQRLIPGGPAEIILGPDANPLQKREWMERYGFADPLFKQFQTFLFKLFSLDFGYTYANYKPVWQIIVPKFLSTIILASVAFSISLFLSILLGVLGAVSEGKWVDKLLMGFSIFMTGCPAYVAGPVLAWIFAVKLNVLPLTGNEKWQSIVLPCATLGLALTSVTFRYVRVGIIEVLKEQYIRTAHAKGLSRVAVYYKHAFKNVLSGVLPIFGIQLGALLSGSIITEQIFAWPGLGSLLIESVQSREYNVVSACVLVVASVYVICNTIADVLQIVVDPRLRTSGL